MDFMTLPWTSHHIFCPIKCSLKSKVYTYHLAKAIVDRHIMEQYRLEMCVQLVTQMLKFYSVFQFQFIHTSTTEFNISSELGFTSMVLSSTTCSLVR